MAEPENTEGSTEVLVDEQVKVEEAERMTAAGFRFDGLAWVRKFVNRRVA